MNEREHLGVNLDALERRLNRDEKFLSDPGPLRFIPVECGSQIMLDAPAKNDRQRH